MKTHPLADWFPMLEGAEWQAFLADVKTSGVLHPVVKYCGHILDGRNRQRAADELGLECRSVEFKGTDAEALAFVMSSNVRRRNLSTQERGEIAARMANVAHGGDRRSSKGSNDPLTPSITMAEAADAMKVSVPTVKRAKAKAARQAKTEESSRPASPPPPKPKSKAESRGYKSSAVRHGLVGVDAFNHTKVRRLWLERIAREMNVEPDVIGKTSLSDDLYQRIDDACRRLAEKAKPQEQRYAEHRKQVAELPKQWQEKFERAVAKEMAHMRQNLEEEIQRAAEAKVPELVAMYARKQAKAEKAEHSYAVMRKGIAPLISESDYRVLLNALHPDREPDRAKLTKCFHIVKRLEPYIDAVKA